MNDRDDGILTEAMALWLALYGQPPIVQAKGSDMIDAMLASMRHPPYQPSNQDEAAL